MSTRESELKEISMTVGWSGDLRDIFVNCNSVSANAVVSISGNLLFQHVHLHEGNVYDFFLWVSEHPGGATAITKWASSGYKLQYPSNHPMDRFETNLARLQYIGKMGETIRCSSGLVDVRSIYIYMGPMGRVFYSMGSKWTQL